jgi:hypothetical protein
MHKHSSKKPVFDLHKLLKKTLAVIIHQEEFAMGAFQIYVFLLPHPNPLRRRGYKVVNLKCTRLQCSFKNIVNSCISVIYKKILEANARLKFFFRQLFLIINKLHTFS